MRDTSDDYRRAVGTSHTMALRVDAYVREGPGNADLALAYADLPIRDARTLWDDSATLKRTLDITVPATDIGPTGPIDLDPYGDPTAPLANFGQQLKVSAGIDLPSGTTEMVNLGWYLIQEWEMSEDETEITVRAVDRSQQIVDYPFPRATGYTGPRKDVFTHIVDVAGLTARIDADVPDSSWDSGWVFDGSRLDAMDAVLEGLNARWRVNDDGLVQVSREYGSVADSEPVAEYRDGSGGTVLYSTGGGDRGRVANFVAATGKAITGSDVVPYRTARQETGPYSVFTYGVVLEEVSVDSTSTTTVERVADERLRESLDRADVLEFATVPDPSLELGDVVSFSSRRVSTKGRVRKISLPLTPGDPMVVTISRGEANAVNLRSAHPES